MKLCILTFVVCILLFWNIQTASSIAKINCGTDPVGFDSGKPHKHKNKVFAGQYMAWQVDADPGTLVEFDFVEKDHDGEHGEAATPFWDGKLHFDLTIFKSGQKVYRGPATTAAKGHKFGYKVTCRFPDGTSRDTDPMIDVPGH